MRLENRFVILARSLSPDMHIENIEFQTDVKYPIVVDINHTPNLYECVCGNASHYNYIHAAFNLFCN